MAPRRINVQMGIKAARRILHGKAQRTISLRRTGGQIAELTRLFITGVSPVTMDDVTSGFNIGTNISIDSRFNELIGFTEQVSCLATPITMKMARGADFDRADHLPAPQASA